MVDGGPLIAALPLLPLVEPDRRALGGPPGAEHGAVEVEGRTPRPECREPVQNQFPVQAAHVVRAARVGALQHPAHRGHLGQVASLIVGGLIALGAIQMLFFYGAAAGQFVYHYWVWDDLVIQATNIAPIAVGDLLIAEGLFRLFRWSCEKTGFAVPCRFVLHHPTCFAVLLFLALMVCASAWGYFRGVDVLAEFESRGGREVATMMDQTVLRCVHLVGTTSRAAVFLRAQNVDDDTVDCPDQSIDGTDLPGYLEVVSDVLWALPRPGFLDQLLDPMRDCLSCGSAGFAHEVFVIDRDKIVCHARDALCEDIPRRWGSGKAEPSGANVGGKDDPTTESLRGLRARVDAVSEQLDQRFDESSLHMDRHLDQIVSTTRGEAEHPSHPHTEPTSAADAGDR